MTPTCLILAALALGLERPGVEYQVFQFPPNQIPRIDGDSACLLYTSPSPRD